ncbi:MAG: 4-hydroxy-tetrahydrodipicolinate reductase [Parachlamydiaceae bacterium]|nr:4-hydroxy-tetrahydrodipicolinate reductase [Parachlamydiaceae bacterium]
MKIALIGYGKMGKLIDQLATQQGHEVIVKYQKSTPLSSMLSQADIVIDFSQADGQLDRLKCVLDYQKPIIIGTTGWDDSLSEAKKLVDKSQGSCLFSPNFSIGVFLFQKIVQEAASLIHSFHHYDVSGVEFHHRQKIDSPSGTAKALAQTVMNAMPRTKSLAFESVRCGFIPGKHSLIFDSQVDTITLTHEARSREGFAQGALVAAEWLLDKKGFFDMDDFIQTMSKSL